MVTILVGYIWKIAKKWIDIRLVDEMVDIVFDKDQNEDVELLMKKSIRKLKEAFNL